MSCRSRVLCWTLSHADYESTSSELITGPLFGPLFGAMLFCLWGFEATHSYQHIQRVGNILSSLNTQDSFSQEELLPVSLLGHLMSLAGGHAAGLLRLPIWYLGKQTGRPNTWVHVCTGAIVGSLEARSVNKPRGSNEKNWFRADVDLDSA